MKRAEQIERSARSDARENTVFVSYRAEDRARLIPLVAALEAQEFDVWWKPYIGGGTDWDEEIQQHLDAAGCVIVAWSYRSVGSEGGFVRDDASAAQRADHYVPIKIDAVEPPFGFGEVQAIDFVDWRGEWSDPCFVALAAAVNAHLQQDPRRLPLRSVPAGATNSNLD